MTRTSFTLRSSKGGFVNFKTNSVKTGFRDVHKVSCRLPIRFREINIASTHTLCTRKSKIHQNYEKIFPYFGPNVYALAFLHICSYAHVYIGTKGLHHRGNNLRHSMDVAKT